MWQKVYVLVYLYRLVDCNLTFTICAWETNIIILLTISYINPLEKVAKHEINLLANGRRSSTLGAYFFCFLMRYFSCKQNDISFTLLVTIFWYNTNQAPGRKLFSFQKLHYLQWGPELLHLQLLPFCTFIECSDKRGRK